MSFDYMRETVDQLIDRGFSVNEERSSLDKEAGKVFDSHKFILGSGDQVEIALECLRYPDGSETYWLELIKYYNLKTFNFEIDSWKYRDDRIEFRYYAREDGVALTFILSTEAK